MTLYNHNYSAIITKGLGGAASCTMLTVGFGLNCGCSIEIVVPSPPSAGGGGPVAGFYVPLPKKLEQQTRLVLVTVKFSPEKSWRRSYVVDVNRADMIVKVINFTQAVKDKLTVGVQTIKTISRSVVAMFDRDIK